MGEYQPASAGSIWLMVIIIIIMMNVWWAIGDVVFLSEPELCLSSSDKEKEKKTKTKTERAEEHKNASRRTGGASRMM